MTFLDRLFSPRTAFETGRDGKTAVLQWRWWWPFWTECRKSADPDTDGFGFVIRQKDGLAECPNCGEVVGQPCDDPEFVAGVCLACGWGSGRK